MPAEGGGLWGTITEQFASSMSLDDALDPRNLLCYEMNGEDLPEKDGFPVQLRQIAPGWYRVADVKWLTRIEVPGPTDRHAGEFHGARLRDHPPARSNATAIRSGPSAP